jgi:subtilisin family serine protease
MLRKKQVVLNLMVIVALLVSVFGVLPVGAASVRDGASRSVLAPAEAQLPSADVPATSDASSNAAVQAPKTSHRLIVELTSAPLATYARSVAATSSAYRTSGPNGRLDVTTSASQAYITQLKNEQAAFVSAMQSAIPGASIATYINENKQAIRETYQIVFNGMAVEPGTTDTATAMRTLSSLPGVKAVYRDYAHDPDMYASLPLINAAAAWNNPVIGGQANAGKGVKVASMDGGIHHDAPMFSGAGFSYPPGYPPNGLGLTANNNGKIIASRVYFRSWDPPSAGDENPWPGTQGTPHGTHTASTAAGEPVIASYRGITVAISGVAPAAWVMSYRVFYNSVTDNGSFYNAEGIAALEDIVRDGADVLNNSWGDVPKSLGGEFDPLDTALINAAQAGIFVSMSNGNAGPEKGTGDHPSSDYINVAASQTAGTYASGRVGVSAPLPISPTLQDMAFSTAGFGSVLAPGNVYTYSFTAAAVISPANTNGCAAWPAGTFTGRAAVISRGVCEFGVKVLNAEQGGATFVVVYNNAGDGLINMGEGAVGNQVTIPSIFVGQTSGTGMVNWYTVNGGASEMTFDTTAYQAGNVSDVIASFSSRGPGVGNVLKPDIAAPGVNILAQGYGDGTGEARHLGFGQASGTSMAAPHVAGSAALLRQIHPDWSNAYIKSALMSTSKYMDIYLDNAKTIPAQPLDMGAGRLDLTNAADPGVILDPPSLSFGLVPTGTAKTLSVMLTNITTQTETYNLDTLYTGAGFLITQTTTLPGFSLSTNVITIPAGSSVSVSVTFDSALGMGLGDNQGYILMNGSTHDAHMAAWARVTYQAPVDVLIIDNDGSSSLGNNDYVGYYTRTLTNLGYTYDILDTDNLAGSVSTFLNDIDLMAYQAVIYFTGDNYQPNGTFTVPTPLTSADMDRLVEYANNGGKIIAMGQDLAAVLNATTAGNRTTFFQSVLGGLYWRDSVSGNAVPPLPIGPTSGAPQAFANVSLDLSAPKTYTASVALLGSNEVPPVATTTTGQANFSYDVASRKLTYSVRVTSTAPITLTASHIHSGTVGVNGAVLYPLLTSVVSNTADYTFSGAVIVTTADVNRLLAGNTYVNVHTDVYPAGEVRGQMLFVPTTDGAANQAYVDEIGIDPNEPIQRDPTAPVFPEYSPILKYPGTGAVEDNVVAMAHRPQPSLELPGVSYLGRSIYTSFGLEGVNNSAGRTSRESLLQRFFNWLNDEPTVTIYNATPVNASMLSMVTATLTSNIAGTTAVTYRWDWGDGTPYTAPTTSNTAGHEYQACGNYTIRVEAVDSWGNHAIGTMGYALTSQCMHQLFLPLILR